MRGQAGTCSPGGIRPTPGHVVMTMGTRLRHPVDIGRACTGYLSADNVVTRG